LFDDGVAVDARKVNSQRRDLRVRVEAATLEERQGPALTVHDAIDLGLAQGRFAPPTTETTATPQI
jgi:hypothetical protein